MTTVIKESPELRIFHLIEAYRTFGHKGAKFNPVSTEEDLEVEELSLDALKFKEEDLKGQFPTCGFLKQETASLQEIIDKIF